MTDSPTSKELASYLARQIFKLGDEGADRTQRLEFKGGEWPDKETDLGGVCEVALVSFLERVINERGTAPEPRALPIGDTALLSDDEIRRMTHAVGGRFHGPNVEHASIEEQAYFRVMRQAFALGRRAAPPPTDVPERALRAMSRLWDALHEVVELNYKPDDDHRKTLYEIDDQFGREMGDLSEEPTPQTKPDALRSCQCGPFACMGPNRAQAVGLRCVAKPSQGEEGG